MRDEELMTTAELARALRVRPRAVRSWIKRGLIPVVRIGERTLRFSWPDVVAALERGEEGRHAD